MCIQNVCTFVRLRHTVFHFESFKHQTFNNQPYVASWQRASKEAKLCGLKQECVEAEVWRHKISVYNLQLTTNFPFRPGQPNWEDTMLKFQEFTAYQILRELNFGHFEAQKLPFWPFEYQSARKIARFPHCKISTVKNPNLAAQVCRDFENIYCRVGISAWTNSLYIEFKFHRVSNCRVQACIKLNFCSSISSFGSSITSFSGFFELEFSQVWVLRVKAGRVFEFGVARSSTCIYYVT